MSLIAAFLVAALAGALLGCCTGLLPGLHVNTLAVVLVALAPALEAALAPFDVPPHALPVLIGAVLLAITVSHTFTSILPATFLGAPDEATALSVLPAHAMLLRGHGFHAVAISAYAAFAAVVASILLLWPFHWLLVGPIAGWEAIRGSTPWLLVLLVAFLIWREPGRIGPQDWSKARGRFFARAVALALFVATGCYGWFSFHLSYLAFVPLPPSPLLPALGGLYGAATLLEALAQQSKLPHQFLATGGDRLSPRGAGAALGVGLAAGAGMSLLPGLTNASATAVASVTRRATDAETLVSLSAVGAANSVFNLVVLYAFERARSGAVVALDALVPLEAWGGNVPWSLLVYLFVALAAAALSLVLTLVLGRHGARRIRRVPYRPLVATVLLYSVLIVVAFTGWMGLLVYAVGASIGFLTVRLGLQRTHLSGVLLGPVLIYYWA